MRRFFRAERLLDLLVIALAVPTVFIAATFAATEPRTTSQVNDATAAACASASPSGCFANPDRRERSLAKGRLADVERAWRAADMRLPDIGTSQRREKHLRLALERCDATAGVGTCTTALRAE